MALGIVNELHYSTAVAQGEVDPYKYYNVYADVSGTETLVAHVIPAMYSLTEDLPEFWVITYKGYPFNDAAVAEANLKFKEAKLDTLVGREFPKASTPQAERNQTAAEVLTKLLAEKDGSYAVGDTNYSHVAHPLVAQHVVHDGLGDQNRGY